MDVDVFSHVPFATEKLKAYVVNGMLAICLVYIFAIFQIQNWQLYLQSCLWVILRFHASLPKKWKIHQSPRFNHGKHHVHFDTPWFWPGVHPLFVGLLDGGDWFRRALAFFGVGGVAVLGLVWALWAWFRVFYWFIVSCLVQRTVSDSACWRELMDGYIV